MLTYWKPSMELLDRQLTLLGAYRVVRIHT
jgi:hypothetical protein